MIFSRISHPRLFFAVLIASACSLQPAVAGKLYKWVDENGMVHYSDKLPPEAAQHAHEQLNSRGQMVESVKDPQEEIKEQVVNSAEQEERRHQAEVEARERMRDRILLDTFTTERDLELTRKDRLNAADSLINLMKSNNERIQSQISETQAKVDKFNAKGQAVPENLQKQLESLNSQLAKNKQYIDAKQEERRKLVEQFDADLKRFRELKGIQPPAQAADPELKGGDVAAAGTPPAPTPAGH